jgi:DNA-binding LytR/AlgR family response regulator
MGLEKITKYRPCKGADLGIVEDEVRKVEGLAREPYTNAERKTWNLHQVQVGDVTYLVADAKYLNKHTHQKGRGNLRLLLDRKSREYVGLALELDKGNYRKVA